MKQLLLTLLAAVSLATISCGDSAGKSNAAPGKESTPEKSTNHLSMKIDGKLWEADNDISGAFHPKGYNKLIMIAGSKGPKNKDEQTFNINLYNTEGPATFNIVNGNADQSVVQLANISPENYLYGSMMGFTMKVVVTKASSNPTVVEATFEGELSGNASDKIKITEGKFYYHE